MNTQTQTHTQKTEDERNSQGETIVGSAQTVIGFAILGCMVAGGVGIAKALSMESGSDVLLCLLGSVAAFGTVFFIYLRKS
jgi:hypothetical protein